MKGGRAIGLFSVLALAAGGFLLSQWRNAPWASGVRSSGTPASTQLPGWVEFPGDRWTIISPEEAGLDAERFSEWVDSRQPQLGVGYGGQRPDSGGVVIGRGGYLIQVWGDPDYRFQSASVGKTFTRMALQLAVDKGLIGQVNDEIHTYWSGAGQLAPHKVLNQDHHRALTFDHLAGMTGGFPISNGHFWEIRSDAFPGIPEWADWTGDPRYDNYAHVEPGRYEHYSSGGYWRLSQALTAIWGRDLKQVLDDHVMNKIGIAADDWEWLSGEQVYQDSLFYPEMPGYGNFLDPPFRIDGNAVIGGGGWVVMSAGNLARVGLLIATDGLWRGERIISRVSGGAGAGDMNGVEGWGVIRERRGFLPFGRENAYFYVAKVAGRIQNPASSEIASWINGPVQPRVGRPPPRDASTFDR